MYASERERNILYDKTPCKKLWQIFSPVYLQFVLAERAVQRQCGRVCVRVGGDLCQEHTGRFIGSTSLKAGGRMLTLLHASANTHSSRQSWDTLNTNLLGPGHVC